MFVAAALGYCITSVSNIPSSFNRLVICLVAIAFDLFTHLFLQFLLHKAVLLISAWANLIASSMSASLTLSFHLPPSLCFHVAATIMSISALLSCSKVGLMNFPSIRATRTRDGTFERDTTTARAVEAVLQVRAYQFRQPK